MKVQVYLVDMVSEVPMGAEARLNCSSTIAPIKKSQKIVSDFNMPCQCGVCVGVRWYSWH